MGMVSSKMARKNVIIILFIGAFLFTSCSGKVDVSFLFEEKEPPPDSSLVNVERVNYYTFLPEGLMMHFQSQHAVFDLETRIIRGDKVTFQQLIDEKMNLEADTGRFNMQTQQFTFHDNIVYSSPHGGTLITNYLEMDNIQDTISTNQDFQLQRATGTIQGKGFRANRNLTEIHIVSAYGHEGE